MLRKLVLLAVMVVAILSIAMPASADVETNGIVVPVGTWAIMTTANPISQSGGVGSVIIFDVEVNVGLACFSLLPCDAPPDPISSFYVSFDGIYGIDATKFSKTGGDTGTVIVDGDTSFNAIITCDTSEIGTFTAQISFINLIFNPTTKSNTVSKVVSGAGATSFASITCIVTETGAVMTVTPAVTSENTETGAPLRVYCSDSGNTFFIYRSVGDKGELEFITTESEVEDAGLPFGTPVIIEESNSGDIVLYRLNNGRYLIQMFVPDPVIGGKVYSFVWGPCAYGKNGAIGFSTP